MTTDVLAVPKTTQGDGGPEHRCVVRLRTSQWADANGVYEKKSLTYQQRKSRGFNYLSEEIAQIGADKVLEKLEGLSTCEDGLYEVAVTNVRHDWESGAIDDWDLKLTPYTP
jgi:hypothetical protein